MTDNIRGNDTFICNCCPCHCAGLVGFDKADQGEGLSKTNFLSSVDAESCQGAGLCVEECPYDALSIEDAKAKVDEDRCIRCGVCVGSCPSNALSLNTRPTEKREKYYESIKEFGQY